MIILEMNLNDIERVLKLYIDYYNNYEEYCWTEEKARKRLEQVLSMMDSFSLIMNTEEDIVIGFAMGYFKQYDDIIGYTLEEIIIAAEYQRKGYGSLLLKEIETKVREKGACCIELLAVNDELHEKYYTKAGYKNAANLIIKVKWFKEEN
jgi:hypothetical protein